MPRPAAVCKNSLRLIFIAIPSSTECGVVRILAPNRPNYTPRVCAETIDRSLPSQTPSSPVALDRFPGCRSLGRPTGSDSPSVRYRHSLEAFADHAAYRLAVLQTQDLKGGPRFHK